MEKNAIQTIRKQKGVSRAELAKRAGTSPQQIARLENGERRLTVDWASRLAAALETTVFELLGGDAYSGVKPPGMVPLIGEVSCGAWREAVQDPIGFVPSIGGGPATFALVAAGDSMDKLVPEGGVVGVDPDDLDLLDGRAYIAMNAAGETTAKRYRSAPAALIPVSTNPNNVEIALGREPFTIVGRIVWALTKI